jgi:malate permease and related proteins
VLRFPVTSYWQLLQLILPVFALIAIGVVVRRAHWVEGEAETSLIRLVVNLCYPCLIFESVTGNAALREAGNVLLPPLLGFGVTALGFALALYAGKAAGLTVGAGLRTFALTVGVCNYAYLPLPIMAGLWGRESQGVLLVHNVGVEAAVWTVGVLVLNGLSLREGWRKLVSPIVLTLVVAVALNLLGMTAHLPRILTDVVHSLAVCAIPLGLLMTGVSLANYLGDLRALVQPRTTVLACALRLAVLPLAILALAKWLPLSPELKRVLVVQAAMPSGVIPIIVARHYGGQPLTAVQIVLGTTALGMFTIPLWLRAGLAWVF